MVKDDGCYPQGHNNIFLIPINGFQQELNINAAKISLVLLEKNIIFLMKNLHAR